MAKVARQREKIGRDTLMEARVVAAKELTQAANRASFHVEKMAFLLLVCGTFLVMTYMAGSSGLSLETMARFGRQTFLSISLFSCIALSLGSLISSTGIIMSETTGKRLDILRITSLSLTTIVIGKAMAVCARYALVIFLLLPVLAATQLLGGVSAGDVAKAMAITLVDIFFVTAVGVHISAGARTLLDRVVRSLEALFVWLILSSIVAGIFGAFSRAPGPGGFLSVMAGASPIFVWYFHMEAHLDWLMVLVNALVHGCAGYMLITSSVGYLQRTIRTASVESDEPKMRNIIQWRRQKKSKSPKGKSRKRQRDWAGTLIGSQIAQTSLVAMALPIAIVPVIGASFIAIIFGELDNALAPFVVGYVGVVLLAMVAVQAASAIAREKARHAAEVLSTTPAGEAKMLWWKGGAIVVSQSVSIAVYFFFSTVCIIQSFKGGGALAAVVAGAAGFSVLLLFALAAGLSFSHVSKGPFQAIAMLAASVMAFSQVAYYLIWNAGMSSVAFGRPALILGLALIASRNLLPGICAAVLCVGTALAVAGGALILPTGREYEMGNAIEWLIEPIKVAINSSDRAHSHGIRGFPYRVISHMLAAGALQAAIAAAFVAGAFINFTPVFLRGAKPKD